MLLLFFFAFRVDVSIVNDAIESAGRIETEEKRRRRSSSKKKKKKKEEEEKKKKRKEKKKMTPVGAIR